MACVLAGAITSNLAGTHVTYGTAAGRHLFEPDSLESSVTSTGALDRLLAAPPARQLRFKAEPTNHHAISQKRPQDHKQRNCGFVLSYSMNIASDAVNAGQSSPTHGTPYVPLSIS